MSEVLGSIAAYFQTRLKTPFYALIGFWWIVLHWEFFMTAFFVDQEAIMKKTGLLKNEYLVMHYANWHDPKWWALQLIKLLIAFALTYIMIWLIPKNILLRAFEAQKEHEYDKRQIKLKLEQQEEVAQTKLESQSVEKLKVKKQRTKLEKDIQKDDPTVLWDEEYQSFARSPLYTKFEQLITSLYSFGGKVHVTEGSSPFVTDVFKLDQRILAYVDTNEIVNYDRKSGIISLTEKGKYFVKRFQQNK